MSHLSLSNWLLLLHGQGRYFLTARTFSCHEPCWNISVKWFIKDFSSWLSACLLPTNNVLLEPQVLRSSTSPRLWSLACLPVLTQEEKYKLYIFLLPHWGLCGTLLQSITDKLRVGAAVPFCVRTSQLECALLLRTYTHLCPRLTLETHGITESENSLGWEGLLKVTWTISSNSQVA